MYEYFYDKPDIIILNFNQHSRRKFNAALNNDSSKLLYEITEIQKLYVIKRDVVEAYLTEDAKLEYCKIYAICLLEALGECLKNAYNADLPSSAKRMGARCFNKSCKFSY